MRDERQIKQLILSSISFWSPNAKPNIPMEDQQSIQLTILYLSSDFTIFSHLEESLFNFAHSCELSDNSMVTIKINCIKSSTNTLSARNLINEPSNHFYWKFDKSHGTVGQSCAAYATRAQAAQHRPVMDIKLSTMSRNKLSVTFKVSKSTVQYHFHS